MDINNIKKNQIIKSITVNEFQIIRSKFFSTAKSTQTSNYFHTWTTICKMTVKVLQWKIFDTTKEPRTNQTLCFSCFSKGLGKQKQDRPTVGTVLLLPFANNHQINVSIGSTCFTAANIQVVGSINFLSFTVANRPFENPFTVKSQWCDQLKSATERHLEWQNYSVCVILEFLIFLRLCQLVNSSFLYVHIADRRATFLPVLYSTHTKTWVILCPVLSRPPRLLLLLRKQAAVSQAKKQHLPCKPRKSTQLRNPSNRWVKRRNPRSAN